MLRLFAALALLLGLAACGSAPVTPDPPPAAMRGAPPRFGPALPPAFGDAKPYPWAGRSPQSYPVHGIDVSRWQSEIDWAAARAAGVNFAFLKATEGGDLLDPRFHDYRRGARAAGIPTGAYHFWYHCRPAAEQARSFIVTVRPDRPAAG